MFRASSFLNIYRAFSPSKSYRVGLLLATSALLFLTACEDASNVGLGLVGEEQGGQPVIREVEPAAFRNEPLTRPRGSLPRVLAGRVIDPLTGTVEVDGYFDMSTAASSDFRSTIVTSAELRLRPAYTYGDTTEQVTFALRPIEDEFSMSRPLPADTTLATGAVIREFSFRPTDTLVVVSMPEIWVDANDEVLRSTSFGSEFHGFKLEQIAGNAVIGFGDGSELRAFADSDSAFYPISRAYAATRRVADPNLPAERLLYQAGVGPIAAFQIDVESIDAAAINQAKLVFHTDTLTLSQKPTGFRRPIITSVDLYGALGDDRFIPLASAELDSKGRFIFDNLRLAQELQRVLLGTRTFEHFEIRLPVGQGSFAESNAGTVQGSISVQLFYDTTAAEKAPEGFLTVTPLD